MGNAILPNYEINKFYIVSQATSDGEAYNRMVFDYEIANHLNCSTERYSRIETFKGNFLFEKDTDIYYVNAYSLILDSFEIFDWINGDWELDKDWVNEEGLEFFLEYFKDGMEKFTFKEKFYIPDPYAVVLVLSVNDEDVYEEIIKLEDLEKIKINLNSDKIFKRK